MMRLFLALFIAVSCFACTDKSKVPDDIIPQPRMEKILWDMVIADRYVNDFVDKPTDTIDNSVEGFKVYEKVFKVHNISRDDFLKSYKYYLGRPDLTRTMFDSISAQSERKRSEIYSRKFKTDTIKPKIDSLRKRLIKK